jgi:hypothetical protein
MQLKVEPYLQQKEKWPQNGKVRMAQYDADSVVVYWHTDKRLATLHKTWLFGWRFYVVANDVD